MPYYPIYLRKTAQHLQTHISSYSTATIWWFFILYIYVYNLHTLSLKLTFFKQYLHLVKLTLSSNSVLHFTSVLSYLTHLQT